MALILNFFKNDSFQITPKTDSFDRSQLNLEQFFVEAEPPDSDQLQTRILEIRKGHGWDGKRTPDANLVVIK
ncbi:MAG: hypothetical protein H0U49_09805 [Parachlamydiaceae bacterium]|nr:hypothetical protein [Parachlamydiaceae bacterium]